MSDMTKLLREAARILRGTGHHRQELACYEAADKLKAASRLQAPAVADIGMAEIETVARSDAKCDGRDFDGLGRADKERYRSRAWAGLRALRTGGSE